MHTSPGRSYRIISANPASSPSGPSHAQPSAPGSGIRVATLTGLTRSRHRPDGGDYAGAGRGRYPPIIDNPPSAVTMNPTRKATSRRSVR